ncbi:lipopolysaccharide assembly protein LapA domain-containing protein [Aliiroseovarius sp.]|uniref:lipopolysaccharide assembly protein LapA domain-containing protein n=1 Tax=Aliiroseovarius sp. TaxID=1872442 RepID=UPI00260497E9|nr:lipopolysaccharide assembly protein LapA domain-containing protein [Aliiroseovarius sp.]
MRYIRYAFLAALAVCLITVALANRGAVTLQLLPEGLTGFLGFSWTITLPLFIIIFGAIIAGVLIGFVWEWLREHKHRAEGARAKRSAAQLEREVKAIKTPESKTGDDVLALLEEAR